jgi:hypothetical protein
MRFGSRAANLYRLPFGPELPSGLSLRVEDTAEGRLSA